MTYERDKLVDEMATIIASAPNRPNRFCTVSRAEQIDSRDRAEDILRMLENRGVQVLP